MWFWYALTFAILSSFGTVIAKKILVVADENSYIWLGNLFTIPILFILILLFFQIPKVDLIFIKFMSLSIVIDTIAIFFAFRSLKISEISLINPLSSFNPVFAAIFAYIILNEDISLLGWFGILLIVIGAYLLQIKTVDKKDILKPFISLITNRGVQYAMLAYLLLAITPILQKRAIFHTYPTTPPFVALFGMIGVTVIYTLLIRRNIKKTKLILNNFSILFICIGIIGALGQLSAFMAFSQANIGLVTAVFKLNMIFVVVLGKVFFSEKNIKEKLLGSFVMLLGVTLMVI